jgi:hypothetical protein
MSVFFCFTIYSTTSIYKFVCHIPFLVEKYSVYRVLTAIFAVDQKVCNFSQSESLL